MATAVEKLANNMNFSAFGKASELKKRLKHFKNMQFWMLKIPVSIGIFGH